jgi:hypothetical protein
MAGRVPAIHIFGVVTEKAWITGISPVMTTKTGGIDHLSIAYSDDRRLEPPPSIVMIEPVV